MISFCTMRRSMLESECESDWLCAKEWELGVRMSRSSARPLSGEGTRALWRRGLEQHVSAQRAQDSRGEGTVAQQASSEDDADMAVRPEPEHPQPAACADPVERKHKTAACEERRVAASAFGCVATRGSDQHVSVGCLLLLY